MQDLISSLEEKNLGSDLDESSTMTTPLPARASIQPNNSRNSVGFEFKAGQDLDVNDEIDACNKMQLYYGKVLQQMNGVTSTPASSQEFKEVISKMKNFETQLLGWEQFILSRHDQFEVSGLRNEQENQELKDQIRLLSRELTDKQRLLEDVEDELIKAREQSQEQKKTIEKTNLSISERESVQQEELSHQFQNQIKLLKAQLRDEGLEKAQLQGQLSKRFNEIDSLNKELREMTSNFQEMIQSNQSNQQNDEVIAKARNSIQKSTILMDQVDEGRRASVGSTKSDYRRQVNDLEDVVEKERDFVSNLQKEIQLLKSKNDDLEEEVLGKATSGTRGLQAFDSQILGNGGLQSNLQASLLPNQDGVDGLLQDDGASNDSSFNSMGGPTTESKSVQVIMEMPTPAPIPVPAMKEGGEDDQAGMTPVEKIIDNSKKKIIQDEDLVTSIEVEFKETYLSMIAVHFKERALNRLPRSIDFETVRGKLVIKGLYITESDIEKALQNQVIELEAMNKRLGQDLDTIKDEVMHKDKSLKSSEGKLGVLKSELEDLNEEKEHLNKKIQEIHSEKAQAADKPQASNEQVQQLEKERNSALKSVELLHNEINEERNKILGLEEQIETKVSVQEDLKEANLKLKTELKMATSKLEVVQQEKQKEVSSQRMSQKEVTALKEKVKKQDQMIQEVKARSSTLISKIQEELDEKIKQEKFLKAMGNITKNQQQEQQVKKAITFDMDKIGAIMDEQTEEAGQAGQSTSPPKQRKAVLKNTANNDFRDYMSLYGNDCIRSKILKLPGGQAFPNVLFSDYITRINSNCERKIRTFFVSDFALYILVQKGHKDFTLKFTVNLDLVRKITYPTQNSTLIKLSLENQ